MTGGPPTDGRHAALTVVGVTIASTIATVAIGVVSGVALADFRGQWVWWPIGVAFSATGALITLRRPQHPIGWLFLWSGLSVSLTFLLQVCAIGLLEGTASAWTSTASDSLNVATVTILLFAVGTLFPDGRLPSPRWRWTVGVVGCTAVVGMLATLAIGGWGGDAEQALAPSPLRDSWGEFGDVLSGIFYPLLLLVTLAATAALVLRFRRSEGVERQQMKWLALAFTATAVSVTAGFAFDAAGLTIGAVALSSLVTSVALVLIPVAVTVAILRHGLYEIDVVISRTVTFGILAGFITALYAGIVVGVGSLLGGGSEPNLSLSIAATALVAVVFEPVRSRVTGWSNRLVFGRRATPYEVMAELTARLSEVASWEEALGRLAGLVADGTGASRATVWLRVGDELRLSASAPAADDAAGAAVPVVGEDLPVLPGAVVESVTHAGELLGAITVDKPRGDTVTPADQRLIGDAAAGASLLFRNLRLNAELADRAAELRASRRRLVASHDAARRKLERDLHDGAQQEVVALKVKLGLARTLAQREGADHLVDVLERLAQTTQLTVETMRTIARGIYPPLLEAEGLHAAISAAATLADVPVDVTTPPNGRYAPEVEATLYFTVLEAIRATGQTRPTHVTIELTDDSQRLTATVTHHRPSGPVPTAAAGMLHALDRITALDGVLLTQATPDRIRVTTQLPHQMGVSS